MLSRWQRGSVYKTGKNPVWYGRFREDHRTPEGAIVRRVRKIRLGTLAEIPTKAAARDALREHMQLPSKPTITLTFNELVERWRAVVVPTIKSSSATHYQNALRSIVPTFGAMQVSAIKRHDVELFISDRARRYSRSTLRSFRSSLSIVLGWAVDNGWLEVNPCLKMKLPRSENCGGRTVTRNALTADQVLLLAATLAEPYATLVVFLAATGLRIGEAAGVRWSDLDGNVLNIVRRVYTGKVDDLKTKGSRRQLPLSNELVARLMVLRTSVADGWIFAAANGEPFTPGNWLRRYIQPAAKKVGVKLSGWHDFRHALSTDLRRLGTHPKIVSSVLGHSGVQLAMNVYDHVSTKDLVGPLASVSEKLCPIVPKTAASC